MRHKSKGFLYILPILICIYFIAVGWYIFSYFEAGANLKAFGPQKMIISTVDESPERSTIPEPKFLASYSGKAYYPTWCKYGQNIKDTNKIYFLTSESAEEAGYTRSKRC